MPEHDAKCTQHSASLSNALKNDKLGDVVEALLGGLSLNTKTVNEQTLLYVAACAGSKDITSCLIGKGADINLPNQYGRTVLHQLVLEGCVSMAETFIELPNVDLSRQDHMGRTVVHYAAEWGRHSLILSLAKVSTFPNRCKRFVDCLGSTTLP
jgi:ankyrin repeat protein